jgi:hypothetical protein
MNNLIDEKFDRIIESYYLANIIREQFDVKTITSEYLDKLLLEWKNNEYRIFNGVMRECFMKFADVSSDIEYNSNDGGKEKKSIQDKLRIHFVETVKLFTAYNDGQVESFIKVMRTSINQVKIFDNIRKNILFPITTQSHNEDKDRVIPTPMIDYTDKEIIQFEWMNDTELTNFQNTLAIRSNPYTNTNNPNINAQKTSTSWFHLYGPTSTGKTVYFENIKKKFIGYLIVKVKLQPSSFANAAAGSVHAFFKNLFKVKNCIIFLDECDELLKGSGPGNEFKDWLNDSKNSQKIIFTAANSGLSEIFAVNNIDPTGATAVRCKQVLAETTDKDLGNFLDLNLKYYKYNGYLTSYTDEVITNFKSLIIDIHAKIKKSTMVNKKPRTEINLRTLKEIFKVATTKYQLLARSDKTIEEKYGFTIPIGVLCLALTESPFGSTILSIMDKRRIDVDSVNYEDISEVELLMLTEDSDKILAISDKPFNT